MTLTFTKKKKAGCRIVMVGNKVVILMYIEALRIYMYQYKYNSKTYLVPCPEYTEHGLNPKGFGISPFTVEFGVFGRTPRACALT